MKRFIRYNITHLLFIAFFLVLLIAALIGYKVHTDKIKAAEDKANNAKEIQTVVIEEELNSDKIIREDEFVMDVSADRDYFDVPLSHDIQDTIFERCEINNIEPELIISMIDQESDFRPTLMGDGGDSYGLMQIQLKEHKNLMYSLGCSDLLDPNDNVTVGIELIGILLDNHDNDLIWALMDYNGGPNYAKRKINAGEVSNYAREVITRLYTIKAGAYSYTG